MMMLFSGMNQTRPTQIANQPESLYRAPVFYTNKLIRK